MILCLALLAVLPATAASHVGNTPPVSQAGESLLVRPPSLLFKYQPPGSYGDEETSGQPLYPTSGSPVSGTGRAGMRPSPATTCRRKREPPASCTSTPAIRTARRAATPRFARASGSTARTYASTRAAT